MDNMGEESPIRYNKIQDFIIYGFNKIELNSDNGEFGLEDDKIEGDCFILPNTIIPTEGDYFEIEHITDSTWLFMVKDVQKDTLDNGSNTYKLTYKLEYLDHNEIQSKIVYNFRMIEEREGTNIAKIVRCEDYDIAKKMDEKAVMLKDYFIDLFYNDKVQTFIYMDITGIRVYDPFMIEFLIRNKVLDNGTDSYIYVAHQLKVPATFSIDYDKTFLRVFELNKKEKILTSNRFTNVDEIKSYGTTFAVRYEDYFRANYHKLPGYNTCCLDEDMIMRINDNNIIEDIEENKEILWQNIIIKYFNYDDKLTEEEINSIENIDFKRSKDAFYNIPILIFCLEKYIENTLK
jgi:hypothetical protein